MLLNTTNIFRSIRNLALISTLCLGLSCTTPDTQTPEEPEEPNKTEEGYIEPMAEEIIFTNAQISYLGDDIGDETSDGWLMKFYTDMEIDDAGNPIGPGDVVQLLLSALYNPSQVDDATMLEGVYFAQKNTGDFSPFTFAYGYMDYIELPGGRFERADGTFYASLAEGETSMDYDLVDDGAVSISRIDNENYLVEGILVGKKCYKRRFSWIGKIEPISYIEPEVPNSTLSSDITISNLKQMQIQDRGDIFFLKDESYRCLLIHLATEGVDLSQSRPAGNGEAVRVELLVPFDTSLADGIPAGTYPMLIRNENGSFNRESITPFHALSGLPDEFTVPYLSGTWYFTLTEGSWGESYARIDGGSVTIRREEGKHIIDADLTDSSTPAYTVEFDVAIPDNEIITL